MPASEVPEASSSAPKEETTTQKPGKKKFERLQLPTPEQMVSEEFMNNCAVRTALSGAMGSVLGVMFGLFIGTMDGAGGGMGLEPMPDVKKTARQVLKETARNVGSKSLSYAKGFAAMGALFAGSECVIEKMRAKHDGRNSIYAGCTTGAILAHSGGPKAMCVGCATFAAFSALIDRFMSHD